MKRQQYSAYVRLSALLSFPVYGTSPEDALANARAELKDLPLIAKGLEYLEGTPNLTGVIANDE